MATTLENQSHLPSFAPNFLDDHARRMISDPEIALIELVANCWDAGADRVDIKWPEVSRPDLIEIRDNGTGMTSEQFLQRWLELNYDRVKNQGEDVIFPPDNRSSHRKAFGRNGKGRHSMFCFANEYFVESWCNGEANIYRVVRSTQTNLTPYEVIDVDSTKQDGHGTNISAELARNHIEIETVRDLLGSKFVTDPTFKIYLNGQLVKLTSLEHIIDTHEISIEGVGVIKVSQVDTQATSRTSRPHGVAWWVNKRLVGKPSWKNISLNVDRRTVEARRYTFVVEADILVSDVNEDWSGFRNTEQYEKVHRSVEKHIRSRLVELMRDVHKTRKRIVLEVNRDRIVSLPLSSRYYIGKTIDDIQSEVPSINENVLSATVAVLSNLEKARSGFTLIEQLAELDINELDGLSDILQKWSVQEAQIVLNELERRLRLIEQLELFVDDPHSDELHDIHPLFERALWIFGPEYESIRDGSPIL